MIISYYFQTEWMETTGKKIISIENSSNVILMDYSEISDCNYMYLATKVVYELSASLAGSIKQWDLDLNRTRIIGFSVGAHIGKFMNFIQTNAYLKFNTLKCGFSLIVLYTFRAENCSWYHWNHFKRVIRSTIGTN